MNKRILLGIAFAVFGLASFAQSGQPPATKNLKYKNYEAGPNTGPVPDYSQPEFWAATPFKNDNSDIIPAFLKDEVRDTRADVFFIHPTSYFGEEKNSPWNADLRDTTINNTTDNLSILLQSTVFNGSCRVFAPRYRQGNMEAFYVFDTPEAKAAFDLAYRDVRKAFQFYLKHYNKKRPLIIASHSQGSLHAIRLLQEFFDGKPLAKQLVCAYVVGYQIKKDAFSKLPVGQRADQTGCFVGWRSYMKGEMSQRITAEDGNSICVNPLTWTTSNDWASESNHLGFMLGFEKTAAHTVACGIEPNTKIVWVETAIVPDGKKKLPSDLHRYDYNLFWMNIRQNVKQRIDAWYKANQTK